MSDTITDTDRIEWLNRQKEVAASHEGYGDYRWYWDEGYGCTFREKIDEEIKKERANA